MSPCPGSPLESAAMETCVCIWGVPVAGWWGMQRLCRTVALRTRSHFEAAERARTRNGSEMNDESQRRMLCAIDGAGSAESKLAAVRQILESGGGGSPANPNPPQVPPANSAEMAIPPGHVLRASVRSSTDGRQGQVFVDVIPRSEAEEHFHEHHHRFDRDADQAQPGAHRRGGGRGQAPWQQQQEGHQDLGQPGPDRNNRGIQAPPGYVLRASASSDGRGEVLDFQPVADASRHMRERHERGDQPFMSFHRHEWHQPHQQHWSFRRQSGPRM